MHVDGRSGCLEHLCFDCEHHASSFPFVLAVSERSMDAVSQLAQSIPYLSYNPAVRSLAVRLLGRILGKNLSLLLGTVAGKNPKGGASTHDEIVFSASLLAALSVDDETVEMLMDQRNVYKEDDAFVCDNRSPEMIVSLIHSVTIPAALASVITIAR